MRHPPPDLLFLVNGGAPARLAITSAPGMGFCVLTSTSVPCMLPVAVWPVRAETASDQMRMPLTSLVLPRGVGNAMNKVEVMVYARSSFVKCGPSGMSHPQPNEMRFYPA